ncbi:MAG: hypothetical protein LUF31_08445 [Fusobacterium sp.]|nr:hypothetical protein [Fusobacterium sp.]
MEIPKIDIKFFEETYIEHITEVLRISKEEFEEKLEDDGPTSINKKANRFITTYLKNRTEKLTEDNWLAAKELYIQWKLFEGIELEKESQDKKESLLELLQLFRDEVVELEEQEIEKAKKSVGLLITKRRRGYHV